MIYSLMVAEAAVWYAEDPDPGLTMRLNRIRNELHLRLKHKTDTRGIASLPDHRFGTLLKVK